MANITESATWEAGITQLETTTQVLGGPSGPSNTPLKQLANRTLWLKGQVEGKSALGHGHSIGEIANLQATLDGKSALGHGHSIGEIANLQATLDGKAPYSHAHAQADITGLAAALAGKSDTSHGHGIAGITGLQAALDAKAANAHGHGIADVSGLQAALDAKASSSHGHTIANITGLQTVLDGKAAASHTHTGLTQYGVDILPIATSAVGGNVTWKYQSAPVGQACTVDLSKSIVALLLTSPTACGRVKRIRGGVSVEIGGFGFFDSGTGDKTLVSMPAVPTLTSVLGGSISSANLNLQAGDVLELEFFGLASSGTPVSSPSHNVAAVIHVQPS